jgi:hypothetical protein
MKCWGGGPEFWFVKSHMTSRSSSGASKGRMIPLAHCWDTPWQICWKDLNSISDNFYWILYTWCNYMHLQNKLQSSKCIEVWLVNMSKNVVTTQVPWPIKTFRKFPPPRTTCKGHWSQELQPSQGNAAHICNNAKESLKQILQQLALNKLCCSYETSPRMASNATEYITTDLG